MAERDFTYASFQQYLTENQLMGAACGCSAAAQWPPRPICPECAAPPSEWADLGQTGELAGFSVIYVGTTAMINAGFDRNKPYCVGIVKLDSGPSVSAFIHGVDVQNPETIKIGSKVVADFAELGPEGAKKTVLAFRVV